MSATERGSGAQHPPAVEEFADFDEPVGPSLLTRVNPKVLAWLGLAIGVVIAVALMLSAGHQNYQSCVEAVSAKYGPDTAPLTRLARLNDVKKCSHSPF
jgi:hypothetical protein